MCFTFMTAIAEVQVSSISNAERFLLEFCTQVVCLKIKHLISCPPRGEGAQRPGGPIEMGGRVRGGKAAICVASLN